MKKIALSMLLVLFVFTAAFANGQEEAAAAVSETSIEDVVAGYFANMPDHIYKISQVEFVEKVKAGTDMTILDIRQPDAYAEGHVQGAVNVPWGTALTENLQYVPQSGEVYIYCYSGQTAGQAVMLLNAAGVPARSVNLGFNFGISKVEGVDAVLETAANSFDTSVTYDVDPAVFSAYKSYYEEMVSLKDTTWKNFKVSEDNAKKILDAGDDSALFLSIRQEKDYNEGHIEGAINIPFGNDMFNMFASLPADKKIIVYCYSGQTAGQATAALQLLGYDAVSMNGGMGVGANKPIGWTNKGYPVVK